MRSEAFVKELVPWRQNPHKQDTNSFTNKNPTNRCVLSIAWGHSEEVASMHLGVAAAQLQNLPGLVAWGEVNVCPAGPEDASDGADRLDAHSTLWPQGAGLSPRVEALLPLLPMPFSVTCAACQDHHAACCNAHVKAAICAFSQRKRSVDKLKPTQVWHNFSATVSPDLSSLWMTTRVVFLLFVSLREKKIVLFCFRFWALDRQSYPPLTEESLFFSVEHYCWQNTV